MLQKISWDTFKIKNENQTKSFEDLCYHLFCREHNLSNGIKADFNQAGLETYPIKSNITSKIIGFQAKFFEPSISYSQIEKSIKKALSNYKKDKLKEIYIYLNVNAVLSSKAAKKIEDISKKEGVSIVWISKSKFEILLNQPKNFDLAQLYFGLSDEFGFIKNSLRKNEVTFINSKEFIKLPLVDFENQIVDIDLDSNKSFLITGNPGSGKSQFMKQLFVKYSGLHLSLNDFQVLINNGALPMLINLKDCFSDSLENIIRNRQKNYKVSNNLKFIYLLDGLDELNEDKAEQVICYIKNLESETNTKNVIISCRKGNLNRLKAITHLPNIAKCQINDLDQSYILSYFLNKSNLSKEIELKNLISVNKELIEEIKDIYLIKILWDIIEKLHLKSTIIELIEHKINELINDSNHRNEIQTLNLFNPKEEEILLLNENISYKYSTLYQFRFQQKELQKFLLKKYTRLDYSSVNDIINYNSSLFFDISTTNFNVESSFIYQHRRYQEYFFARKLKKKYELNPKVLRKKDLLISSDFFDDIFLKFLRSEYEKDIEKNLPFLLELNLINIYNGKSDKYYADEPYFKESKFFLFVLSLQSNTVFEELINDENLNLEKYIYFTYNEVQQFYEKGHKEFALKILSSIDSDEEYKVSLKELKGAFFIKFQIDNESDYVEYFKKDLRKKYKTYSNVKDYMNDDQSEKEVILKAFFDIGLKYKFKDLLKMIKNLTDYELLVFLSFLSDVQNLNKLLNNKELRLEISQKIKKYKIEPNIDNIVVYFFMKFFDIEIPNDKTIKIQTFLVNISQRINSHFFGRFIKPYTLISYILGQDEFNNTLDLKDKYKTQDAIVTYCFVFENYVNSIKGSYNIEMAINAFIYKYDNWESLDANPKECMSILWSNFYSSFIEKGKEKRLLNYILKISNNYINKYTFFKELNQVSDAFHKIVCEEDILEFEDELNIWKDDFPRYVERCLILSGFYSSIDQNKSIFYLKKAILNSFLRHGWRKDIIISYYLNTSFERIITNNWKSKKEILKIADSIFSLNLKLYEITDLKETKWGIVSFIGVISYFDLKLARKYFKKFKNIYYDHSMVINRCLREILILEISNNFISITKIEKEMNGLSTMRDYQGKVADSYYEDKIIIYMEVLKSNFYNKEDKKIAFDSAYNQISLLKEKKNYQNVSISSELLASFNTLCKEYKKDVVFSKVDVEIEDCRYKIINEEDFKLEIINLKSNEDLEKLYKKFKNSTQFRIELKNIDTWKLLIDKTYLLESNLNMFIDLLKSLYYLDYGNGYSYNANYLYLGVKYAFSQQEYKNEILEYYSKESGHSGFYNSILIYEQIGNKNMTVKLFDRFHKFCDFLVN
ncbi:NACHT domain-containing protein [Flavobacterium chungangense]|uniref:NACHT domain-containing protein n=3 Tax=Flavobacterium chungangense TaxID=554283 RepID=UPI0004DF1977|nr:hypothetical protein [Flavobacterium chungangense]